MYSLHRMLGHRMQSCIGTDAVCTTSDVGAIELVEFLRSHWETGTVTSVRGGATGFVECLIRFLPCVQHSHLSSLHTCAQGSIRTSLLHFVYALRGIESRESRKIGEGTCDFVT